MRSRRWVVVLAVLIVAVVPLTIMGLRVVSRHPAVKRAALKRLMPDVQGQVSIGELDLGLASVHLGDVMIELWDDGFIYIPSATVNLSYRKFLLGQLRPEEAVSGFIVEQPRIRLVYGMVSEEEGEPLDVAEVARVLPDYVGVSDATLIVEHGPSGRRVSIASIDLLLNRAEDGDIEGALVGDALGGVGNLRVDIGWDAPSSLLTASGILEDARLARALPLFADTPVEPVAGELALEFEAALRPEYDPMLGVTFEFEGVTAELPDIDETLEDVEGSGRFNGDILELTRLSGTWHGAAWEAEGSFCLSTCDLEGVKVVASDVPIAPIVALVGTPPVDVTGEVDLEFGIRGTPDAGEISVRASDGSALVGTVWADDITAMARLTKESVIVDSLAVRLLGGALVASGGLVRGEDGETWELDLSGDAWNLDLTESADLLGDVVAEGTLGLSGLRVRGTPERLNLESLLSWRDAAFAGVDLGAGAGGFLLADGSLTLALTRADSGYAIVADVPNVFGERILDARVTLRGLDVDSLLAIPSAPSLPVTVDGELDVGGEFKNLAIHGRLEIVGAHGAASLDVEGELADSPTGQVLALAVDSDDAIVRGVAVPFAADVTLDASEFTFVSSRLADVAELRVRVGLGEENDAAHPVQASLVVSEAELADVASMITGEPAPEDLSGLVFSSVSVQGTVEEPRASVQLSVGNGELGGIAGLDAALLARVQGSAIELSELTLSYRGQEVVTASGTADIDGELAMTVRGEGIPGALLGAGEGMRLDLAMDAGGETKRPTFDARLESSGGELLGIPYDTATARVTGAAGIARVAPLILERDGSYRLSASGRLPYGVLTGADGTSEGSLSVEVDGDPLALLAELASFASSASGEGRLDLSLVVDRDGVTVASGELDARADRFVPTDLFEEITDVSASARVVDGVLVAGEIAGHVDGRRIAIASRPRSVARGHALRPLVVFGIDLGTLALSTDPEGVAASVPGLMPAGDVGRIAARGRDGAPDFLIGGPADRPLLWGELEYSDMSFTYPFPKSPDDDGAEDKDNFFLDSEWALSMSAGRNVWYRRPDANLKLERGSSLDFRGVPSEGTLCLEGRLESTTGSVTYAYTDFDVELVSVEFPPFCEPPRFYVEAETRVEDGTTISLTIDSIEAALTLASPGATLDESALVLASDSPDDNTQERIMSKLQYGVSYDLLETKEQESLERRRALEVVSGQISGQVFRPLLSPVEARIRRNLRLDLVRLDVDFVEHFLGKIDRWNAQDETASYVPFLSNSRVTLGKYVSRDWLLSYVGFAESYEEDLGAPRLGLRSELGIEYEVSRNTSLSLRVVYDPSLSGWDRSIAIEHRYRF